MAGKRDDIERSVRERCDAGDYDGAATLAIKGYGAEVYGFLLALHREEAGASEVFSIASEGIWRGLPRFAWGCSLRTWVYTIARHASFRYRKNAGRHARRAVPLTGHASVLAAEVRTATQPFLQTEQKDRFARLRESLPPEDQMLLVLRVDRDLAWNELARILLGEGDGEADEGAADVGEDAPAADEETLKREAARLRKRFQLVKEKLLELGKREGLFHPKG